MGEELLVAMLSITRPGSSYQLIHSRLAPPGSQTGCRAKREELEFSLEFSLELGTIRKSDELD